MNRLLSDLERHELEKDLDLLRKRYAAIRQDIREEPHADKKVILEERARSIETEIRLKEEKLGIQHEAFLQAKGQPESAETDQPYGAGARWAALVGISEYKDAVNYWPLPVCANDVKMVRDGLLKADYDIDRIRILDRSPVRNEIISALQSLADATERDDLLLFYFSGHGDKGSDGGNYLVAHDSYKNVLAKTGVALADVREILQGAKARAKVIMIDACHSGVKFSGKGPRTMPPEFIEQVYGQAKGWAAIASCEQGQLSYTWEENGCSVFTHYLLEALAGEADFHKKGFVSVQDVHNYVLAEVKKWAAQNNVVQTPTLHSEVAGDIPISWYDQK
jgi:hypothetical protein